MTPEQLDPTAVLAFRIFFAAFAAGAELSQMTPKRKPRPEPYYNPKVAIAILAVAVVVLLLMYFFGSEPPI